MFYSPFEKAKWVKCYFWILHNWDIQYLRPLFLVGSESGRLSCKQLLSRQVLVLSHAELAETVTQHTCKHFLFFSGNYDFWKVWTLNFYFIFFILQIVFVFKSKKIHKKTLNSRLFLFLLKTFCFKFWLNCRKLLRTTLSFFFVLNQLNIHDV